MPFHRLAVFLAMVLILAGCDSALQHRFRTAGPGLELGDPAMAARTAALAGYFDQLCPQADLAGPPCDTAPFSTPEWQRLVFAGFNDIDLRCDEYLGWLDEQRTRMQFVNEGVTALSGLLGGVLGIAAPNSLAINYVTLALGFTTSLYNAYHNLALLGIEASTIKTIVIERRLKFRTEFRDAPIGSKPEAVYVLRSYLMLCTPQTITLDVNTYSRDVAAGQPVAPDRRIDAMRRAIGPIVAEAPADIFVTRGPVADLKPAGFAPAVAGGYEREEVKLVQRALCLEQDGVVGPQTEAGMGVFEEVRAGPSPSAAARSLMNRKIDDVEYDVLASVDCDASLYRNFFENDRFANDPDARIGLAELLNEAAAADPALAAEPLPEEDFAFDDEAFRARVAAVRTLLGVDEGSLLSEEVTPQLYTRLRG